MVRWSPMDTAPRDGSRIRVRTAFGENTARWHPNGLWVAGWEPISFNDEGQPKSWRVQTEADDAADRQKELVERGKALRKMANSTFFMRNIELEWEKRYGQ